MSSGDQIAIGGDLSNTTGAAIGAGASSQVDQRAMHTTVVVQSAAAAPLPDEPKQPPIPEQIRTIRMVVLQLQQMFIADRTEREQHQTAAAQFRADVERRLAMLDRRLLWTQAGSFLGGAGIALALLGLGRWIGWW